MKSALLGSLAAVALAATLTGCASAPGYPRASDEVVRPDKQTDFAVLYKQNCSGCHGEDGRGGAALALNNTTFLAIAGASNIRAAVANGLPGTLMPAFSQHAGGMLTDAQVDALVYGMTHEWSMPSAALPSPLPPYAVAAGDATRGAAIYQAACARCHGAAGAGTPTAGHSIVDPSYLALVNDQTLHTIILAAHPETSAPDWRKYIAARPLTAQEIDDIVAWLAQHRTSMSPAPVGATPVPAAPEKAKP